MIFGKRHHGPAWRQQRKGHVNIDQLKVMSPIELGGHVLRCGECKHAARIIVA